MHTVIETPAFLASARDERISDNDRAAIVSYVSKNPDAGEIMPGTGGRESFASPVAERARAAATAS